MAGVFPDLSTTLGGFCSETAGSGFPLPTSFSPLRCRSPGNSESSHVRKVALKLWIAVLHCRSCLKRLFGVVLEGVTREAGLFPYDCL